MSAEAHLQRYSNEFDFCYNNRVALGIDDAERATRANPGGGCQEVNLSRIEANP